MSLVTRPIQTPTTVGFTNPQPESLELPVLNFANDYAVVGGNGTTEVALAQIAAPFGAPERIRKSIRRHTNIYSDRPDISPAARIAQVAGRSYLVEAAFDAVVDDTEDASKMLQVPWKVSIVLTLPVSELVSNDLILSGIMTGLSALSDGAESPSIVAGLNLLRHDVLFR